MTRQCRENHDCNLPAPDCTGVAGNFQGPAGPSVGPSRKNHGVYVWPDTAKGKGFTEEKQGGTIGELQARCARLEKEMAALVRDRDRKNASLAETRIALHVLLKNSAESARQVQEKILFNVEKFVVPYLQKLQMECVGESQQVLLKVVRSNLSQITSSFAFADKENFSRLTPTQIQVMDLIKYGHTTKEIAVILHLSPSTVACHRQEIRKRLSLNNKKITLYAALNLPDRESETRP